MSRYFLIDILFTPIVLAASMSAVAMQIKRLRERDIELSEKLIAAAGRFEPLAEDAEHRLLSGLKLLDTVTLRCFSYGHFRRAGYCRAQGFANRRSVRT